jgi:hypothetical protein
MHKILADLLTVIIFAFFLFLYIAFLFHINGANISKSDLYAGIAMLGAATLLPFAAWASRKLPSFLDKLPFPELSDRQKDVFGYTILAFIGVSLLAVIILLQCWVLLLPLIQNILGPYLKVPFLRLCMLPLVLEIAVMLFFIRKRARRLYAISEVSAGIIACWAGLEKLSNTDNSFDLGASVALASGIYIIVRGLANFDERLQAIRVAEAEKIRQKEQRTEGKPAV